MNVFNGTDATQAVLNFALIHGSKLPDDQREFLLKTLSGPDNLLKWIVGAEVLYASRAVKKFPVEGVQLMHDLASFIQSNNFYGLGGPEGRMLSVMAVARRILDGGVVEVEGDPAVSADYSAPVQQAVGQPPLPPEPTV